jgi:dTMP kinase
MAKLLVLEGTDGAGKSTQTNLVKSYLKENNLSFAYFHFPMYGHNKFSEMIAKFLQGEFGSIEEVSPYFVANLYAMDRFMFLPELKKAMAENDVVLLDRYVFSNVAYQGAKFRTGSIESARIKQWILDFEFGFLELPYPDLNIFFDVPIEVVKQRLEDKRSGEDRRYLDGKSDIHEADLEFQSRVRDNYLSCMEGTTNCKVIECAYEVGDDKEIYRMPKKRNYIVIGPENLFINYKQYIDFKLFSQKYAV